MVRPQCAYLSQCLHCASWRWSNASGCLDKRDWNVYLPINCFMHINKFTHRATMAPLKDGFTLFCFWITAWGQQKNPLGLGALSCFSIVAQRQDWLAFYRIIVCWCLFVHPRILIAKHTRFENSFSDIHETYMEIWLAVAIVYTTFKVVVGWRRRLPRMLWFLNSLKYFWAPPSSFWSENRRERNLQTKGFIIKVKK